MAETRPNGGSANTAIVAIVVLILVAVVVFVFFFWNDGAVEQPAEGPDVELQVEPPADGGNGSGNGGSGNAGDGGEQ